MITKLTKYQEQKMYEYRDEGIKIARDTTPINHAKLERIVKALYAECRLDNNLKFMYFDFFEDFTKLIKSSIESIDSSIWSSIWSSIDSIDSSIKSSIDSSIDSSIWSSIWSSIDSSIKSSIWSSIWSSIDSSIKSSIWSSIWSSIKSSIDSSIWSSIWWGQYNINWIQYHVYYNDVIGFKASNQKLLKLLIDLSKNSHILFLYKNTVCVIEKPISIKMERNQLHSFDSMAVEYKNGKGFYLSHNVQMPKKYITTPADKISINTILKEENSEIRRELLRKVGIDNFIKKCKAKPIDRSNDGVYELYKVKLGKDKTGMYLKMKNPSIDTYHFEGVVDVCDTIEKALAWRDSEDVYIKPSILT